MPSLLEQLRAQRTTAREAADAILERARVETRDLTGEEFAEYQTRTTELREVDDRIEAERDREVAELRAATVRRPGPTAPREPVLTREQSVYDWCQTRGMFDQTEEPLSFYRYLRGMATGLWDDAPQERPLAAVGPGHRPGQKRDPRVHRRRHHRPHDQPDPRAGPADRRGVARVEDGELGEHRDCRHDLRPGHVHRPDAHPRHHPVAGAVRGCRPEQ